MSNFLNWAKIITTTAGSMAFSSTAWLNQQFAQQFGISKGLALSGATAAIGLIGVGETLKKICTIPVSRYSWGTRIADMLFWGATASFGIGHMVLFDRQFATYATTNQQIAKTCERSLNTCVTNSQLCPSIAKSSLSILKTLTLFNRTLKLPPR
jgi:hypothetical protein